MIEHVMQTVSTGNDLHEMSKPVLWGKKRKNIKMIGDFFPFIDFKCTSGIILLYIEFFSDSYIDHQGKVVQYYHEISRNNLCSLFFKSELYSLPISSRICIH